MSLQNAINHYHDLLTDKLAAESQEQMEEQMRLRGLYFGERPLCTVLRPRFFLPHQYNFLRKQIRPLLSAFNKISHIALENEAFLEQFGLLDWEKELLEIDPGYKNHTPLTRLDAFYVIENGELKFTEYNAEVPAASAYNDVLTELFYGLPVMGAFLRKYAVRPLPTRHSVLHELLAAYREWGGGNLERPRIAILDWAEVPTRSEFELFTQYFQGQGFEAQIVDPREVEFINGRLMHGDFHINVIYKRVLITELIERLGIDQPVVNAIKENAVCIVNPFYCKVLYKKLSLAVLSDEKNEGIFNEAETRAIKAHIPWTRRVKECKTVYGGLPIDLVPFMMKYKDQLVLKPNDDYGGRGIVLGWQTNSGGWEKAVQVALETPHVVQERVAIPTEAFPSFVNGRLQIYDRMLDTAPFIFHGDYVDGCLTRLSTDPLLNVSAGGGSTVPTFVVEKR